MNQLLKIKRKNQILIQIILKFKSEKFPSSKNFTRKSVDAAFFSFCSGHILKLLSFVALMFQKRYEIP